MSTEAEKLRAILTQIEEGYIVDQEALARLVRAALSAEQAPRPETQAGSAPLVLPEIRRLFALGSTLAWETDPEFNEYVTAKPEDVAEAFNAMLAALATPLSPKQEPRPAETQAESAPLVLPEPTTEELVRSVMEDADLYAQTSAEDGTRRNAIPAERVCLEENLRSWLATHLSPKQESR